MTVTLANSHVLYNKQHDEGIHTVIGTLAPLECLEHASHLDVAMLPLFPSAKPRGQFPYHETGGDLEGIHWSISSPRPYMQSSAIATCFLVPQVSLLGPRKLEHCCFWGLIWT